MIEFVAKTIPTFLLFSIFSWANLERAPRYLESFADQKNYLTLEFENQNFHARWTTDQAEREFRGEKKAGGEWIRYEMELPEGHFVGKLTKSSKKCEPELHYTIENDGRIIRYGKLRAAFCL